MVKASTSVGYLGDAFANTSGGTVLIGVEDGTRHVSGIGYFPDAWIQAGISRAPTNRTFSATRKSTTRKSRTTLLPHWKSHSPLFKATYAETPTSKHSADATFGDCLPLPFERRSSMPRTFDGMARAVREAQRQPFVGQAHQAIGLAAVA
jgi:Schlafen, AlbA_2